MVRKSKKWRSGGSGSLWGAPGEHLGAKMAPKSAKRSLKRGVDGQLGAKMGQLGSKMGSQIYGKSNKSMQRSFNFLGDFLMMFWRGLGAKMDQEVMPKSMQKACKKRMDQTY